MASGLSGGQQLFAAVLVAGIVGTGSAVFSEILYHPEELDEPAYKIEVANAAEGAGAGGPAVAEEQPVAVLLASADVAQGEKTAKKCGACHSFEKGGANKVGPALYGVVDRDIGGVEGYTYSAILSEKPGNWDYEALNGFLKSPKDWAKGTKMAFSGIEKETERAGVIVYLRSLLGQPGAAAAGLRWTVPQLPRVRGARPPAGGRRGRVQRRYFRTPVAVDTKADASPVTAADREAEAVMRELIGAAYPGHGILGEEHGRERLDASSSGCSTRSTAPSRSSPAGRSSAR
jgi:cytochrome c